MSTLWNDGTHTLEPSSAIQLAEGLPKCYLLARLFFSVKNGFLSHSGHKTAATTVYYFDGFVAWQNYELDYAISLLSWVLSWKYPNFVERSTLRGYIRILWKDLRSVDTSLFRGKIHYLWILSTFHRNIHVPWILNLSLYVTCFRRLPWPLLVRSTEFPRS